VDWGHLGSLLEDGHECPLWGFTMTLGYSRRMMAEAATDQKLGTLLRMHEAAFRQWKGVPEEILYDRMKTVWTGTDERGGQWYWALECITGDNSASDATSIEEAKRLWLDYAVKHHYIG
jgi:hypothetical protein